MIADDLDLPQLAGHGMPLLEIESLHVEMDGKNAGEVHAIMGPNGSAEVDILAQALLKTQEFFT
jgi:Fe-S cluster assembly ATPase SufC